MSEFLGWVLLAVGIGLVLRMLRRRKVAAPGQLRLWGIAALLSLALGLYMALAPRWAMANMGVVQTSDPRKWLVGGPDDALRWETAAPDQWSKLAIRLGNESESYVVFPVDWEGNAFRAEWEMTITQLDIRPEWGERASVAVGVMDGTATSLDDPDHVGGSAIQACFSDDVRLRTADDTRLLKTASSTEQWLSPTSTRQFTPGTSLQLRTGVPYRCVLAYSAASDVATLEVSEGGRRLVARRLEDIPAFTGNLSWFGVTVRGYKRRNKKLEAELKTAYKRPAAEVEIRNLVYRQP